MEDVKVKDGSQLHFVSDTEIQQINFDSPVQEQKAILPVKNQAKILELQKHLNRLKQKGKRKRKQSKF